MDAMRQNNHRPSQNDKKTKKADMKETSTAGQKETQKRLNNLKKEAKTKETNRKEDEMKSLLQTDTNTVGLTEKLSSEFSRV